MRAGKNKIILICGLVLFVVGCNSGSSNTYNTVNYPSTPTNSVGPNNNYQCLPSRYPGDSTNTGLKIAYGSDCKVSDANNMIKPSLESMAISISYSDGDSYCTGTPLSYDSTTGLGYVLTAAHCVVSNVKAANTKITLNTITIRSSKKYVNQNLNADSNSGVTGTIKAAYVPEQYCYSAAITQNDKGGYTCSNIPAQNGDIALLQVKYDNGVKFSNSVELADSNLNLPYPSYIMALGYGITDTNPNNTNLFYITYEYFANNSYMGENGLSTIMNGYSINNAFYSIICRGDSGGGDFYWDEGNSKWQLVGVHSYGSKACGQASSYYPYAMDASADVRPFTNKLNNLMSPIEGCHAELATQNGFICATPQ